MKSKSLTVSASLSEAAKNPDKNILSVAVEAARARATLGEISDALEKNLVAIHLIIN